MTMKFNFPSYVRWGDYTPAEIRKKWPVPSMANGIEVATLGLDEEMTRHCRNKMMKISIKGFTHSFPVPESFLEEM